MKTKPSAPKKSTAKKAPVKKAPAKKPATKKAGMKKAPAQKPVAKKAPAKPAARKKAVKKVNPIRVRVDRICAALDSKKGENIVVLHVAKVSGITDYMVLCTGMNTPHLRALNDEVIKQLRLEAPPVAPHHRAGITGSEWLVLDYFEIIVHLFTPPMRTYYALEQLWKDAPTLK